MRSRSAWRSAPVAATTRGASATKPTPCAKPSHSGNRTAAVHALESLQADAQAAQAEGQLDESDMSEINSLIYESRLLIDQVLPPPTAAPTTTTTTSPPATVATTEPPKKQDDKKDKPEPDGGHGHDKKRR